MARFATLIGIAALLVAPAQAATAIGKVSRVQGEVNGTIEGNTHPLGQDDAVYLDEALATGDNARLEVSLDDQTVLTVGEKATLHLDQFVYQPDRSVVKVTLAGAFRFVSGKVGANAARDASIATPFAVIAVRGTDVWGGPIDGALGVYLFEGAVDVTNAGVTASLTTPGQGVDLAANAAPPGAITLWAQDKVARAVATVTFP
jgi:hypothetical protein